MTFNGGQPVTIKYLARVVSPNSVFRSMKKREKVRVSLGVKQPLLAICLSVYKYIHIYN